MANRSVYIDLGLRAEQYKTEADQVIGKTKEMDREVEELDRDINKLGPDAAKAAAAMTVLGEQTRTAAAKVDNIGEALKRTDTEIERSKTLIQELAAEFGRTGDLDIVKKIGGEQGNLSRLERLRKDLDEMKTEADKKAVDISQGFWSKVFHLGGSSISNELIPAMESAGAQGARVFGQGFMGHVGPVLAAGAPAVGLAVAELLSLVGAAVAGGTLAATGLGGIAVGIAAQFHDPRVMAAVSDLGDWAKGELDKATSGFVPAMLSGFGALRREAQPFFDSLSGPLRDLAPYVANLLARLGEGLARLGPGLGHALEAAGPILERIGADLPGLLATIGGLFDKIAASAKGGGEAIHTLIEVTKIAIEGLGGTLYVLSHLFDFFVQAADRATGIMAKIPVIGEAWKPLHGYVDGIAHSMDGLGISAKDASGQLTLASAAAAVGTGVFRAQQQAAKDLADTINKITNASLGLAGADLQLRTDEAGLVQLHKEHGSALQGNTADALANQRAFLGLAQDLEATRQKEIEHGATLEEANAHLKANEGHLLDMAQAAGFDRDKVKALIDEMLGIPNVDRTIVINEVRTHTDVYRVIDQTGNITGGSPYMRSAANYQRYGGVYEHAAAGLLREADTFSAVPSGARYAFAEPATGGEAFIPRYGDYNRSMAILGQAASWYGASVVAGRGGGSVAVHLTSDPIPLTLDGRKVAELVIQDARNGGTAFNAYVRQVANR